MFEQIEETLEKQYGEIMEKLIIDRRKLKYDTFAKLKGCRGTTTNLPYNCLHAPSIDKML